MRLFDAATGKQRDRLKTPQGQGFAPFGQSLDLEGSLAVVGATGFEGAVHVYAMPECEYRMTLQVPTLAYEDEFGSSVALSGTRVVAGAHRRDSAVHQDSGAAYLFDLASPGTFVELVPSQSDTHAMFGHSVAIGGRWVVVGAPHIDDDYDQGAAYVFDAATGAELFRLTPPSPYSHHFGSSVSIDSGRVLVGSYGHRAYLYDLATGQNLAVLDANWAGSWIALLAGDLAYLGGQGRISVIDIPSQRLVAEILSTTPGGGTDGLGDSFDVRGRRLVVGAPRWKWGEKGGAAYLIDRCSPIGTSYCGPAVTGLSGWPARLLAFGSDSVADDDFLLRADHVGVDYAVFLASNGRDFLPGAGGSMGNLCLDRSSLRHLGPPQSGGPTIHRRIQLADLGVQPGDTLNFQVWYRDRGVSFPVHETNFTDGVSVVFQ